MNILRLFPSYVAALQREQSSRDEAMFWRNRHDELMAKMEVIQREIVERERLLADRVLRPEVPRASEPPTPQPDNRVREWKKEKERKFMADLMDYRRTILGKAN